MKAKFISMWNWAISNPLNFFKSLLIGVIAVIAICLVVKVIVWAVKR